MHQVGFSLHDYTEMHGQQNIKYSVLFTRRELYQTNSKTVATAAL